jgi:DNA repair exonuclease SbcCD ATPase subunit
MKEEELNTLTKSHSEDRENYHNEYQSLLQQLKTLQLEIDSTSSSNNDALNETQAKLITLSEELSLKEKQYFEEKQIQNQEFLTIQSSYSQLLIEKEEIRSQYESLLLSSEQYRNESKERNNRAIEKIKLLKKELELKEKEYTTLQFQLTAMQEEINQKQINVKEKIEEKQQIIDSLTSSLSSMKESFQQERSLFRQELETRDTMLLSSSDHSQRIEYQLTELKTLQNEKENEYKSLIMERNELKEWKSYHNYSNINFNDPSFAILLTCEDNQQQIWCLIQRSSYRSSFISSSSSSSHYQSKQGSVDQEIVGKKPLTAIAEQELDSKNADGGDTWNDIYEEWVLLSLLKASYYYQHHPKSFLLQKTSSKPVAKDKKEDELNNSNFSIGKS